MPLPLRILSRRERQPRRVPLHRFILLLPLRMGRVSLLPFRPGRGQTGRRSLRLKHPSARSTCRPPLPLTHHLWQIIRRITRPLQNLHLGRRPMGKPRRPLAQAKHPRRRPRGGRGMVPLLHRVRTPLLLLRWACPQPGTLPGNNLIRSRLRPRRGGVSRRTRKRWTNCSGSSGSVRISAEFVVKW